MPKAFDLLCLDDGMGLLSRLFGGRGLKPHQKTLRVRQRHGDEVVAILSEKIGERFTLCRNRPPLATGGPGWT